MYVVLNDIASLSPTLTKYDQLSGLATLIL
jgi:hypothetical protein